MICFLGTSHAAQHLQDAAFKRGMLISHHPHTADIVFISEDTPTDDKGNRQLAVIHALVDSVRTLKQPIVLTSQVPPGFSRALGMRNLYHQAETLRIKDAIYRADNPEYIAIGASAYGGYNTLPLAYLEYLEAFYCPKRVVPYEVAEFSKIAVNMMLAAQVDATNKLAAAAKKADADWWAVAEFLKLDSRIGPNAYLTPGRWQDSKHLMRDYVTLEKMLCE
mgnify:FL=1